MSQWNNSVAGLNAGSEVDFDHGGDNVAEGFVIDVNGKETTPAQMVRDYEMIYRPGVLLFDGGKLLRRHDSLTFPHHFKESLRFVAGGYYKQTDYRTYSRQRTEALLEAGETIDLGRPKLN